MKKASALFDPNDKDRIKAAVAEAEKATSGEIVPVVATVSGRYDRAEDLFGLLSAMALLAILWKPLLAMSQGGWGGGVDTRIGLGGALLAIVIGFVAGAMLATRFPGLRSPFVPRSEMKQEVERRAQELEALRRDRLSAHELEHLQQGSQVLLRLHRGRRVVADGVESEKQAALLGRLGCHQIQGDYVSRALDPEMFAEFVKAVHLERQVREVRLHLNRPAGREAANLDLLLTLWRFQKNQFRAARRFVPADLLQAECFLVELYRLLQVVHPVSRVKQLQGLLPICSYCKKVRDDQNYWQQVDTYITKHTDVAFSHSICPTCYDLVIESRAK
jgi:hypothetical protein